VGSQEKQQGGAPNPLDNPIVLGVVLLLALFGAMCLLALLSGATLVWPK
jgi:hypothetical protein